MARPDEKALREQLVALLKGGQAHVDFEKAVAGLAPEKQGQRALELPYSPWELLEHLRITQWDILEFSRDTKHKSPDWPSGYWPKSAEPPTAHSWEESVRQFRAHHKALMDLVQNESSDLFAPIPGGDGQTLLREVLLVADHNAYHIGQLVLVRRALGAWE
jgi:hypothetical protein